MEEKIIYKKDLGHLGILAGLVGLPASIFLWPLFMGNLTARAFELSALIFPVSALFIYFLYRLYASSRQKIVLDKIGLLVEELSAQPIPWHEIRNVRIVQQPILRGPTANWLVLHVKNQHRFSSKIVTMANRLLLGGGVPACNLTTYKDQPTAILAAILSKLGRDPSVNHDGY